MFTPREAEVLALLAQGRTNRQIGAALYISEKTASVHVSNILAKLGANGRTEAVAIAASRGLLPALTCRHRAEWSPEGPAQTDAAVLRRSGDGSWPRCGPEVAVSEHRAEALAAGAQDVDRRGRRRRAGHRLPQLRVDHGLRLRRSAPPPG